VYFSPYIAKLDKFLATPNPPGTTSQLYSF